MKTWVFFSAVTMLGLVGACAQPQPINTTQAVKSARTGADHIALAKRYEDAATEMTVKVQEHEKQLEEYEVHSYLYGKKAQDLQAHCEGLIRYYKQAAEANMSMAKAHRQLADEARQYR